MRLENFGGPAPPLRGAAPVYNSPAFVVANSEPSRAETASPMDTRMLEEPVLDPASRRASIREFLG